MKRLITPMVPWLCYLLVSAIDSGCSQDLALGADVDQDVAVALALAAAARQAPRPPQAPDLPDDPFVGPVKPAIVVPSDMPGCEWRQLPGYPAEFYLFCDGVQIGKWDGEFRRWRDYDAATDTWSEPKAIPRQRPAQAAGISWVPARQAPAPVAPVAQQPAMRSQRVLVERGNVVCAT